MVELNWAGISRTLKALGDSGQNVLLLKTTRPCEERVLDEALPEDDGESPANGGWSAGPGGWMLLVEGVDEHVNPWIELLARSLTDAGIDGTLTGAGIVGPPRWATRMESPWRLVASIGFRTPVVGATPISEWVARPVVNDAIVSTGLSWLTAHHAPLMASTRQGGYWVDRRSASTLLAADLSREGNTFCESYDQPRRDLRHVSTAWPAAVAMSSESDQTSWEQTVEEMRAVLVAAPLDLVSMAMVSHRNMYTYLSESISYRRHPALWDEYILEPSGIQVLTDRHLSHAHDLSGWMTTRLDDTHLLVEARDLAPWYSTPRDSDEPLDPGLTARARDDFGDMVLTPDRATDLLTQHSPRHPAPTPRTAPDVGGRPDGPERAT